MMKFMYRIHIKIDKIAAPKKIEKVTDDIKIDIKTIKYENFIVVLKPLL